MSEPLYSVNDVVYLEYKARLQGRLENVAIKKITELNLVKTGGLAIYLYTDSFNALYNEYDFCSLEEAEELIVEYNE